MKGNVVSSSLLHSRAADGTVVWPTRINGGVRFLGDGMQYQMMLFAGSGSWNDAAGSLSIAWSEGVGYGNWEKYQFSGRP